MLKRKITTLKNAFSRGNTKSTNVHTKSHHSISGIQETGCGHSDCKCNGKCKVCKCHPETTESGNVVGKSVQDSGKSVGKSGGKSDVNSGGEFLMNNPILPA